MSRLEEDIDALLASLDAINNINQLKNIESSPVLSNNGSHNKSNEGFKMKIEIIKQNINNIYEKLFIEFNDFSDNEKNKIRYQLLQYNNINNINKIEKNKKIKNKIKKLHSDFNKNYKVNVNVNLKINFEEIKNIYNDLITTIDKFKNDIKTNNKKELNKILLFNIIYIKIIHFIRMFKLNCLKKTEGNVKKNSFENKTPPYSLTPFARRF